MVEKSELDDEGDPESPSKIIGIDDNLETLVFNAEQVETLRHDIKNELNALRMGVLLLQQMASSEDGLSGTSLENVAARIDRCLDQINEIVDQKIRINGDAQNSTQMH